LFDRTFSRFGRNRRLARDFVNLAARFRKGMAKGRLPDRAGNDRVAPIQDI